MALMSTQRRKLAIAFALLFSFVVEFGEIVEM
jgi:hypothetical protein